jgi:hypothetical protein
MSQIEYAISGNTQTKVSMGDGETVVETTDTNGYEQEVESGVSRRKAEELDSGADDDQGADDADTGSDVDDAGAGEDGDDDLPSVPDAFDAENPENVEAFNKAYLNADGDLNEDSLSAEFWKNKEGGSEGLNEATYDFLKSKGISKAMAKSVEAALVNKHDSDKNSLAAHDLKIMDAAEGPDALKTMLDWGKAGGYNKAQIDKFNKVMSGTDLEAKLDAIELLKGRFSKTDAAKPTTPKRDATKGQGKPRPGAQPFKDRAEWRQARRDAAEDPVKLRVIDARAKASGF